jgi:hypothetical protein
MRTRILLIICFLSSLVISAQDKMYIHKTDKMTLGVMISETDSVYFSTDGNTVFSG